MKRKNIVSLIAIIAIVAAVIFAGCVREETPPAEQAQSVDANGDDVTDDALISRESISISSIGDILKNADKYMGKEVTIEGIVTRQGYHVGNVYVPPFAPAVAPGHSEIRTVTQTPYIGINDSTGEIRVVFGFSTNIIGSKIRVDGIVEKVDWGDSEEIMISKGRLTVDNGRAQQKKQYGLKGIWGSSSTDVFAVGNHGIILHYDGTVWTEMNSGTTKCLYDVWGSSPDDVFAVGATILHYDGTTWTEMNSGTTKCLYDVWGSSPDDVFAVGATILHYDGTTWTEMNSGTTKWVYGIWGSSPDDVFAVGANRTTILHYDGSTWSKMSVSTKNCPIYTFKGVWSSSPDDVFAVGASRTILHYDGITWTEMTSCTTDWLNGIWGSSSTDVFAVGERGIILHYDGTAWSKMNSGTEPPLEDVWGSSPDDVFAVGWYGRILHYDGSTWSSMQSP